MFAFEKLMWCRCKPDPAPLVCRPGAMHFDYGAGPDGAGPDGAGLDGAGQDGAGPCGAGSGGFGRSSFAV
jgi:hypothetical protein